MFKLAQIMRDYREAAPLCTQVNLFGFVDDETFLTKSGDLGIVLSIEGVDYECLDANTIENLTRRLTALHFRELFRPVGVQQRPDGPGVGCAGEVARWTAALTALNSPGTLRRCGRNSA